MREQRHCRRSESGKPDPEPTCTRLVATGERADRLDADIGSQDEEARCNQLLRTALRTLGADARTREQPEHYKAGKRLDQAVRTETDQRDGACRNSGNERDSELHEVVANPAPCEQSRLPFNLGPFRSSQWSCNQRRLNQRKLGHASPSS